MSRLLRGILAGLVMGSMLMAGVSAKEAAPADEPMYYTNSLIMPAPTTPPSTVLTGLFVGQTHKYKVIFRGNGEAIVYTNIDFTNATDNELSEFNFETPVAVDDISVLQYNQINCGYYQYYDSTQKKCVSTPYLTTSSSYPGASQNLYQRATVSHDGNKYTITLPTHLGVNQDSHLLIGFTTKNFATNFLGGYNYKFESLKVNSRINNMSVNIDVDGGLFLKNSTSGNISYDLLASASADKSVEPASTVINADLDRLVSYMSYSSSISKSFQELSSQETATVSGEYASSWLRLYMNEIVITVVVVAVIFVGLYITVKLYKKFHKPAPKKEADNGSKMWVLVDTALGFGSALAVVLFTLLLLFIGSNLNYYSYSSGYGYLYSSFMILTVILVVMIYAFLILFAPLLRGKKRGWASFGLTFLSEIIFLALMTLIFMAVWMIPQAARYYPVY